MSENKISTRNSVVPEIATKKVEEIETEQAQVKQDENEEDKIEKLMKLFERIEYIIQHDSFNNKSYAQTLKFMNKIYEIYEVIAHEYIVDLQAKAQFATHGKIFQNII